MKWEYQDKGLTCTGGTMSLDVVWRCHNDLADWEVFAFSILADTGPSAWDCEDIGPLPIEDLKDMDASLAIKTFHLWCRRPKIEQGN